MTNTTKKMKNIRYKHVKWLQVIFLFVIKHNDFVKIAKDLSDLVILLIFFMF